MKPNFSGVWSAPLDKSRFASRPPQILQVKILQSPGKLRAAMRAVFDGAVPQVIAFETEIVEAGANGGAELKVGASRAHRGELRDYWSLAEDGATLVMAHRDDALAGQIVMFQRDPTALTT